MKCALITFHLIFILSSTSYCQEEQSPLQALKPLLGGTWVTKGKWKNGADFHQEVTFRRELSGNLITSETKDLIDSKSFEDSVRNYGVIGYKKEKTEIVFYNFDVFGGITEGTITTSENNIFFTYDYAIDGVVQSLTDAWLFIEKDKYEFRVGILKNGTWEKVFISNTFDRQ